MPCLQTSTKRKLKPSKELGLSFFMSVEDQRKVAENEGWSDHPVDPDSSPFWVFAPRTFDYFKLQNLHGKKSFGEKFLNFCHLRGAHWPALAAIDDPGTLRDFLVYVESKYPNRLQDEGRLGSSNRSDSPKLYCTRGEFEDAFEKFFGYTGLMFSN